MAGGVVVAAVIGGPLSSRSSRPPCRSRCRSSSSGCSRRPSRGGSACHRRIDRPAALGRRCRYAAPDRPADLAVLRDVRRPGGQRPAARQLPGGASAVVAHRTSPTNIGMYLLATSRRATSAGSERSRWSSGSRRRWPRSALPRFHGHLYNWYDTRDLRTARAALRVVGRQRQPVRGAGGAVERLPRDARPAPPVGRRSPASTMRSAHARGGPRDRRRAADADAHPAPPRRGPRATRSLVDCGTPPNAEEWATRWRAGPTPGRSPTSRPPSPPNEETRQERARDLGRGVAARSTATLRDAAATRRCATPGR
jgi:hypothetical protein